jgi:Icc-related predicted phosphoesterase
MKILHVSDTHGQFIRFEGNYDIIIHSGDLLIYNKDPFAQREWIRNNSENFKKWIGNKPFLFCSGNHDYIEVCDQLKDLGINAINIDNKILELNGIKFYGFPHRGIRDSKVEMKIKADLLVNILNKNDIDVLVAHCPPFELLDLNEYNEHIGNEYLKDAIDKEIKRLPKLCLFGHCHQNCGKMIYKNILMSNAATIFNLIEYEKET